MNTPGAEKRMSLYEGLRRAVPEQLAAYLLKQRWFGGKARQIRSTELIDLVPVQADPAEGFVLLARVEYDSGPGDTYVLPLISASASGDQSANQSADGLAGSLTRSKQSSHSREPEAEYSPPPLMYFKIFVQVPATCCVPEC
jgi:hypothetical protein